MRFDDYVEACLYDPDRGFYATTGQAGGRRGDFITSPEVGPLFGAVLARYLDERWRQLGEPDPFTVVEVGAGRGALANAILTAQPRCSVAMHYRTVERSARLREAQRELLGGRVDITDALPDVPVVGVVVANELLDNLAPRVFERTGDGWAELHVDGATEVLVACEPPPAVVQAGAPRIGDRAPWLESAAGWVSDAIAAVDRGSVVAIDYGVRRTAELADRQWLRTYRGHVRDGDPLQDPGSFDITVDIACDQLPGEPTVVTQAEFLREHGIAALVDEGRRIWAERAHLGDLAAVRARSRVVESEALLDPEGLGGFLVLEWRR